MKTSKCYFRMYIRKIQTSCIFDQYFRFSNHTTILSCIIRFRGYRQNTTRPHQSYYQIGSEFTPGFRTKAVRAHIAHHKPRIAFSEKRFLVATFFFSFLMKTSVFYFSMYIRKIPTSCILDQYFRFSQHTTFFSCIICFRGYRQNTT